MDQRGQSLQEKYAPENICFGCGNANQNGLRIRSFPISEDAWGEVVLEWTPEPHHEAFDQVLNGGIIGTLMDCHSNWTAIWHLMCRDGTDRAAPCVTAEFHVKMRRPTPSRQPLRLTARAVESDGKRVKVEATLESGGERTATCVGHFVAVGPGHPAFERW